jgi:phosphatidylcholine synthase
VDGTLARYVNVEEALPEVDGSSLDNVIDMFNYSILPVLMIYWFSMVPYNLVHLTCISILLASCYTFSDKNMKTTDYYFKGFSALWNLLVFFLFILELGLWFNFGAICLCLILTFIPIKIIHPFRVKELRNSSILMVGVWSISAIFLILDKDTFSLQQFHAMIFGLWLISTSYFVWISLRRSFKQKT